MLALKGPIDPAANADGEDVINTKSALSRLGVYRGPIDETPTMDMIKGITDFQQANGLRKDGVMKPGGKTERAISQAVNRPDLIHPMPRKDPELERWKTRERVRIGELIQTTRKNIQDLRERLRNASDPLRKQTIKILLDKEMAREKALRDELGRVETTLVI